MTEPIPQAAVEVVSRAVYSAMVKADRRAMNRPASHTRPEPTDACAFVTAWLWYLHPHAESISVRWDHDAQEFKTRVVYAPVVQCAIVITL